MASREKGAPRPAASKPKVGANRGNAGQGRPKGSQNKTTRLLKEALLQAAQEAGGKEGMVGYLKRQAEENPGPFMSLLGKVLPMQLTGDDGDEIKVVTRIELVAPGHVDR